MNISKTVKPPSVSNYNAYEPTPTPAPMATTAPEQPLHVYEPKVQLKQSASFGINAAPIVRTSETQTGEATYFSTVTIKNLMSDQHTIRCWPSI